MCEVVSLAIAMRDTPQCALPLWLWEAGNPLRPLKVTCQPPPHHTMGTTQHGCDRASRRCEDTQGRGRGMP